MKLKLCNNNNIILPLELDYCKRMEFAEDIIINYSESFEVCGSPSLDNTVKIRLDILGTYILNAVPDIRKTVMSRYKQNVRPFQERSISTLGKKYEQIL